MFGSIARGGHADGIRPGVWAGALALLCAALIFSSPALAQFAQQGPKLVGIGAVGASNQGSGVAMASDGNTAIVGGQNDNSGVGAAWVYTRSGAVWSQQGSKLVGIGATGAANQGYSVALSSDGNTAIVGGINDNSGAGAAWIFTRSGSVWTQQGSKLVGSTAIGAATQGISVALSADGNTAIVGGSSDNSFVGAAWVFIRSSGTWSEQTKLVGTGGAPGLITQGVSVALSADGNTAVVGGNNDNSSVGAAWVFTRSGSTWSQQGNKLVGNDSVGASLQGQSVAVSGDGNTAMVGGVADNSNIGAAWIYTRSGNVWSQQGVKLVGIGAAGAASQGITVTLSGDGNTAISGGDADNSFAGAAWVFTRSGGVWAQQGNKLVGIGATGSAFQGFRAALSADGITAILGGTQDNSGTGAAWVFAQPTVLQVSPTTDIASSGNQGGSFSPSSFPYQLRASAGSVNYSISGVPSWLDASSTSGTVTTTPTNVTFTVNASANSLAGGTYNATIVFTDTTNSATTLTISATLNVTAAQTLLVTPATNMSSSGNQGGPFSPPSFQYQLSSNTGSVNYSISGVPSWLDVSSSSGALTNSPTTITFTVNASANSLVISTYNATISFTNTTNGQGNQTRTATLSVNFGGPGPPSNSSRHRTRRL